MTTRQRNDGEADAVDLVAMLGTDKAGLAFHLMNIDYHATQIIAEGNPDHLLMLLDLLTQHAAPIAAVLEQMSDLHVAQDQLIVPDHVRRTS